MDFMFWNKKKGTGTARYCWNKLKERMKKRQKTPQELDLFLRKKVKERM
jgi:hypothetical protein